MGPHTDQVERIILGFAVYEHQVGFDMAVSMIVPRTNQNMIMVPLT